MITTARFLHTVPNVGPSRTDGSNPSKQGQGCPIGQRTMEGPMTIHVLCDRSERLSPGGINRQPGRAGYDAEFLINTNSAEDDLAHPLEWRHIHQEWENFSSLLGEQHTVCRMDGRKDRGIGLTELTGCGLT